MARCKSCGAEITFVKTIGGKAMPCDAEAMPYAAGYGNDTIITPNGETTKGSWIDDSAAEPDGYGYVPHWATCPWAYRHKSKKQK